MSWFQDLAFQVTFEDDEGPEPGSTPTFQEPEDDSFSEDEDE